VGGLIPSLPAFCRGTRRLSRILRGRAAGVLHPDVAAGIPDFAKKPFEDGPFTTQCYVKGEPQNETDGIWRRITDPKERASVTIDFAPIEGSRIDELAARFDIILGFTPEDGPRTVRL
jgi:hypothetical protein